MVYLVLISTENLRESKLVFKNYKKALIHYFLFQHLKDFKHSPGSTTIERFQSSSTFFVLYSYLSYEIISMMPAITLTFRESDATNMLKLRDPF